MFDESFEAAWQKRYGQAAPAAAESIAPFLRHRSVRAYSARPISEELMSSIIACGQSAATSSNLQLWTVVSVQEPERRKRIAELCADQKQVHEAAYFLAFIADHHRLREVADQVGETPDGLPYNEFYTMAVVDAALAAERMVCAAESLGIGICYIGALRNDPYAVRELLELPEGTFGVFGLCFGWPEEGSTAEIKPRLAQDVIWHRETYSSSLNVAEYDERMGEFYRSQEMRGDVTWSMRSGRRIGESKLTGRHVLKDFLAEQQMDTK